jgi:hypothetical protein
MRTEGDLSPTGEVLLIVGLPLAIAFWLVGGCLLLTQDFSNQSGDEKAFILNERNIQSNVAVN